MKPDGESGLRRFIGRLFAPFRQTDRLLWAAWRTLLNVPTPLSALDERPLALGGAFLFRYSFFRVWLLAVRLVSFILSTLMILLVHCGVDLCHNTPSTQRFLSFLLWNKSSFELVHLKTWLVTCFIFWLKHLFFCTGWIYLICLLWEQLVRGVVVGFKAARHTRLHSSVQWRAVRRTPGVHSCQTPCEIAVSYSTHSQRHQRNTFDVLVQCCRLFIYFLKAKME